MKEYFAGLERVYSKEEAGKRIEKGLASLVVKKEEKKPVYFTTICYI